MGDSILELMDQLNKLFERDAPKKVKYHNTLHIMNCPICEENIEFSSIKYCPNCGQRLYYKEEKK